MCYCVFVESIGRWFQISVFLNLNLIILLPFTKSIILQRCYINHSVDIIIKNLNHFDGTYIRPTHIRYW